MRARHAQRLRNLVIGLFVVRRQHERHAVLVRQGPDRGPHFLLTLAQEQEPERVDTVRGDGDPLGLFCPEDPRFRASSPEQIDAVVGGDAQHPARERTVSVEVLPPCVCAKKDFVSGVFRLIPWSQETTTEANDPDTVGPNEISEVGVGSHSRRGQGHTQRYYEGGATE